MPKQDYHTVVELIQDVRAIPPQATQQYHWFANETAKSALSKKYVSGNTEVLWYIAELFMAGQPISTQISLVGTEGRLSFDPMANAPGNPGGIGPTVAIHHSRQRDARSADIDIQYVPSCAPFMDPDLLAGRNHIPELDEMLRVLDLSSYVLAGSDVCRDQLQNYFAIDPEKIIVLPFAPVIHEPILQGLDDPTNGGLGEFAVVYLAGGPNAQGVEHCAEIARQAVRNGAPIRVVAVWDRRYGGGPKANWRRSFDRCVPVTDHHRQWLFARARSIVFWGRDDCLDQVSHEAQILGRQVVMPLIDAHRPIEHPDIKARARMIWVKPLSASETANAFCDSLIEPTGASVVQEDIVGLCRNWRKAETDAAIAHWASMDFEI